MCSSDLVLFGTAGIAILTSKDARKLYTQCTAAVLRGKDCVARTATTLKENCGDIYEDAVDINEKRSAEEEQQEIEDARAILARAEEKADKGKAAEE